MFAFIKKLFGSKPQEVEVAAPYKIEMTETYPSAAEFDRPAPVEFTPTVKNPPVKRATTPKKNSTPSTAAKQGRPRGRRPKAQ